MRLGFISFSRIGFRFKGWGGFGFVSGFLSAIVGFITGLMAIQVPVLGCSMLQLILGLWIFYALGQFVFGILHDDE